MEDGPADAILLVNFVETASRRATGGNSERPADTVNMSGKPNGHGSQIRIVVGPII